MTIGNGQIILAADLNAMNTSLMALVQADNAQLPGGLELNWTFPNLVTGTAAQRRKSSFPVPWDCYVEALTAETIDHTAASTFTASLTGDGNLINFPRPAPSAGVTIPFITVTVTGAVGLSKGARLGRDNTKTAPKSSAATTKAFTVIPRGSTISLSVSSTSIATPSQARVTLVLRQFMGRE